jgi:hypothetical protein
LDPEMRYYREFETASLGEGEIIFREEIFELWPMSKTKTKMKGLKAEAETETETATEVEMETEMETEMEMEMETKTSRVRQALHFFRRIRDQW